MATHLLDVFKSKYAAAGSRPSFEVGDTIRVYWKIKEVQVEKKVSKTAKAIKKATEEGKGKVERVQAFEGVVIAKKHGAGLDASFTVRKISSGVGVERVFPLHSPLIQKIDIVRHAKVRRAKLYYLRALTGRKAKMKEKKFAELVQTEGPQTGGGPAEEAEITEPAAGK